ncbi:MAG: beta-propeller fold lactonase family protein [Verrucomicrobia bacterium]|nr:beta-propeller fold lactonase family protein [Verrucomicrobiota bacterium]
MKLLPRLLPIAGLLAITSCATGPRTTATHAPVAPAQPDLPGQRADGSVLLPNQWSLRPAGKQALLEDFPVNVAVHPSGKFAAVLHCGYSQHAIVVVNIATAEVVSRVALDEAFYGLEFSRDGKTLFSSGAGGEVIHRFAFADGHLSEHQEIALRDVKERGVPAGLAVDNDTRHVYVANLWGHRITEVDLTGEARPADLLFGTNTVATVANLPQPPSDADLAAATKRAEAALDPTTPADPFPYACRLDEQRQRLYVSLWAQAAVAVIDLKSDTIVARWPTQEHPNEMLLTASGKHLFVANGNRNTVTVFDTDSGQPIETISAALFPNAPPGATPNSLALTPDGKLLFIANANVNCIAVFDVSAPGKSRSLGFIPAGWYPTSVRVTPDGKRLLVANGKGIIPKSNRHGPQPGSEPPATVVEYIAKLHRGTLGVIELPKGEKFEKQMGDWTAQVFRCSPLRGDAGVTATRPKDNPVPAQPGDASPIKYVLYIIKENRTYDQVFGDMPKGNSDPSLCIFPERVTPNHHKLAREFVLLDNFYVDGEVSADGHEWTMGAYASDFVEKHWPMSYGHNKRGKYSYPSEGQFQLAFPAGGYLWDRAREAGVTYRSYGEFVENGKKPTDPSRARVKALEGHIDEWYRSFDLDYPDTKRAERFIAELKRFEKEGEMPRLQVIRLPNDHTSGTAAGKFTPTAQVADNDVSLGLLVEAVTRSKFWPRTALFVIEDDAQNGSDHVDCHRSPAFVISPYTRRGAVDSTMYSTSSMLRTIELILGLKPMSQFDAAATPMFNCFQTRADTRPYKALPANVDLSERNVKTAWGGELSEKMNFAKEDAADDLLLNEVIWRSVRGPHSPMPPPVRAAFVRVPQKDDDDD